MSAHAKTMAWAFPFVEGSLGGVGNTWWSGGHPHNGQPPIENGCSCESNMMRILR